MSQNRRVPDLRGGDKKSWKKAKEDKHVEVGQVIGNHELMANTLQISVNGDPDVKKTQHKRTHPSDRSEVVVELSLLVADENTRSEVMHQEEDEENSENSEPTDRDR